MAEKNPTSSTPVFHELSKVLTSVTATNDLYCPGVDKIGCGYDVVRGRIADSEAVKKRLFQRGEELEPGAGDYSLLREHFGDVRGFSAIQPVTVDSGETLTVDGSSLSEVSEDLSGKMEISGHYGKFEGELDVAAKHTESTLKNL